MFNTVLFAWCVVIVVAYLLACLRKNIEVLDMLMGSAAISVAAYIGVSVICAWIGQYSVNRSLMILMVMAVLIAVVFMACGKRHGVRFLPGRHMPGLIVSTAVFIIGVLLIKNGLYSTDSFLGRLQSDGLWLSQSGTELAQYRQQQQECSIVAIEEWKNNFPQAVQGFETHAARPLAILAALAGQLISYRYMLIVLPFAAAILCYGIFRLAVWIKSNKKEKSEAVFSGAAVSATVGVCSLILIGIISGASCSSWKTQSDLKQLFTDKDTIVLDDTVAQEWYVPVRSLSKAYVAPFSEDLDKCTQIYEADYEEALQQYIEESAKTQQYSEYAQNGCLYFVTAALDAQNLGRSSIDKTQYQLVYDGAVQVYKYIKALPQKPVNDTQSFSIWLWVMFVVAAVISGFMYVTAGVCELSGKNSHGIYKKTVYILVGAAVLFILFWYFSQAVKGNIVMAVMALLAVSAATVCMAFLYEKRDIIELFVLAAVSVLFLYIFVTAGLLFWNRFSVWKALTVTTAVWIIGAVGCIVRFRKIPDISMIQKKNIVPIVVCMACTPLLANTFGMFPMGQDQGVYQVRALAYTQGNNDTFVRFTESMEIESESEKAVYIEKVGGIGGYDSFDEEQMETYRNIFGKYADIVLGAENESGQELIGQLHGIHTYSALLALWGSIAGQNHMTQCGVLIFMLTVFLLWMVLGNFDIAQPVKVAFLSLYVFTPQILWQSRTTLVETVIAMIVMTYLYLITDMHHKEYRWLSWIAVAVFGIVHITIYVFLPIFIFIYYILYFREGRRTWLAAAILSVTGYLAGFWFMFATSYMYTLGNYDRVYHFGIRMENVHIFVTMASVITICVTALLSLWHIRKAEQAEYSKTKKILQTAWNILVWLIILVSIAGIYKVYRKSDYPFAFLTIWDYILCSGFISFPIVLAGAALKPKLLKRNSNSVILSILFVYCILLYSVVFKTEVHYYYYYGRYIVPWVAVIVISAADIFQQYVNQCRQNNRILTKQNIYMILTGTVVMLGTLLLPYTAVVTTQQDHTEMQWNIFTEVEQTVEKDSAVVLEKSVIGQLVVQLKLTTEADIYLENTDRVDQFEQLSSRYKNIYYICEKKNGLLPEMQQIAEFQNKKQVEIHEPQPLAGLKKFIPFAEESTIYYQNLQMYQWNGNRE